MWELIKPGDDGAAAEIDDAGGRPRQRADVGAAADRGDPVVAHGQRLRGRGVIDDDLAVEQDGVGRLRQRMPDSQQQRQAANEPPAHRDQSRRSVQSVSMNIAPGSVRRNTRSCL